MTPFIPPPETQHSPSVFRFFFFFEVNHTISMKILSSIYENSERETQFVKWLMLPLHVWG